MTCVLPPASGALPNDDTDGVHHSATVTATVTAIVLTLGASLLAAAAAGAVDTSDGAPVKVTNDIVYRTAGREQITLDAYVPTAHTTKRPVIMLVHGGAWRGGDKSNFVDDGTKLAALGYVAFSVNYRLTPQYTYPAAVAD